MYLGPSDQDLLDGTFTATDVTRFNTSVQFYEEGRDGIRVFSGKRKRKPQLIVVINK